MPSQAATPETSPPDVLRSHSRHLTAILFWVNDEPMAPGRPYLLRHTSEKMCAVVAEHIETLDVEALSYGEPRSLRRNGVARVTIETQRPLCSEPYARSRAGGSFLLIDPASGENLAVGLIEAAVEVPPPPSIGATVWLTGLSAAGKTTLAQRVSQELQALGLAVELLDGDVVRKQLTKDLGFSKEDRDENIRRVGFVAELLARKGTVAVVSFISPYRAIRDEVRARIPSFIEVYVNAPLEVCEARDVKGLYKKARAGLLKGFTGIDDPYEPPLTPEVECRTDLQSVEECVRKIVERVRAGLETRPARATAGSA